MRTLQIEYEISRCIAIDLEVTDEIYEEFCKTGQESLLNIDWNKVHEECRKCGEVVTDYAISDEDLTPISNWYYR